VMDGGWRYDGMNMEATRSVRTPGHEGSVERSRSKRDEKDNRFIRNRARNSKDRCLEVSVHGYGDGDGKGALKHKAVVSGATHT
jgi:hypothetical protein